VTDHAGQQFETLAIHAGYDPDPTTGSVIPPIYATSTYKQDGVGGLRNGYEYSRSANPTRTAVEGALAALEAGTHGLAFSSGLAAEDAILRGLLRPGDHIVFPDDAYGGTFRLVDKVFKPWGLTARYTDDASPAGFAAIMTPKTKLVWIETPTNPLLQILDIAALADVSHRHGAKLAVDNTFASPYLQQPIRLGADLVVHSTTKYLGGHSDVVGGAVVGPKELTEPIKFYQNAAGGVPGPFDCYLVLRGIKTLAVRMDRHCDNAVSLAAWLAKHPAVARVYYPGLPDHPGHAVARKQMRNFGGMISLKLRGGIPAAKQFMTRTKLFSLAESLGGVESLLCHPATMTHASIPKDVREARGVDDGLLRLSVGIEDAADLRADLERALAAG